VTPDPSVSRLQLVNPVSVRPTNVGEEELKRLWLREILLPDTVNVLEVVPPEMVNPSAWEVGVRPLIVLLVKASLPARVAKVPVVGRVTFVEPVEVNVTADPPDVIRFPPRASVPEVQVGAPLPPESRT
jgi:hypothetical protein